MPSGTPSYQLAPSPSQQLARNLFNNTDTPQCYLQQKETHMNSTWRVQVLRSPKEASAAAMQPWRERCEKCLCLQGDYVEKLLHFQLPMVSSFFLNKLGDLRT